MCRWFVYLSPKEPCLLEDVLVTPANSISHQVSAHYLPGLLPHDREKDLYDTPDKLIAARNSLLNMDGLGVAWYSHAQEDFVAGVSGPRPSLYKSISPPVNDFNFRHLCANAQSRTVFAHIRASSGAPITPTNNHPFQFGRHIFMHNGVVSNFQDIRLEMCRLVQKDAYHAVFGSTDSEHLAALYMTYLTGTMPATSSADEDKGDIKSRWELAYSTKEMADALQRAVVTTLSLQKTLLCPEKFTPSSINLAVTDGISLVSFRFRNHVTEQPPSLYYSTVAGVTLNRKYPGHPNHKGDLANASGLKTKASHGKHIIVASEPTTYDEKEWKLLDGNTCLTVNGSGDIELEPITYDMALNGQSPNT